jgi:hypothetical protein
VQELLQNRDDIVELSAYIAACSIFSATLLNRKTRSIFMNARGTFRYGLLLAGTLFTAAPGFAAEYAERATDINIRISRLEEELAELKALVKSQPSAASAQPAPALKAETPAPATVSTTSGAKVQFYGFARLDGSYDTGQIYPGNIALWAQPEGTNNNDAEWNLTAGATRLGMNISGPDTDKLKLSGNLEFDFLSNIGAENNSSPRLRHGYLKAYWPASDFSIIAGQTWDVISSLIPSVDDPAIMWDAGNIGARHPQLRLTKGFSAGEKGRIELAAAASRTIGEKNSLGMDTGKDAAIPTIQARLAWSGPLFVKNQSATVGVSGHYGQEEWDTNSAGAHKTLDSWSCNLELSVPVSDRFAVAGEYFTGSNLDDFYGGIGQGVNAATLQEIRSKGGWAALRYTLNPKTSFSLGAGMDDPNNNDLSAASARTKNQTIFANVINKITPSFILGVQLSDWRTEYKDGETGDALRAQSSLTYKF